MSRHFAKRQVRDALSTQNGLDVSNIQNAPVGSPWLVYRPKKDKCEASFSLVELPSENVIIFLPPPSGPTKFRSTAVKAYLTEQTPVSGESKTSAPDLTCSASQPSAPTSSVSLPMDMPTSSATESTHQLPLYTSPYSLNSSPPPILAYSTLLPTTNFEAARINEFNL